MQIIVYDIEIKKAILGRNEEPIEGIEYCQGWSDHTGMGISSITAYDYAKNRMRVFMDDNMGEFALMVQEADLIVGFNSIAFDNKVCRANGIAIPEGRDYDILVELWAAAGLPRHFAGKQSGGFGLDATCDANFGLKKTGNGALAPVLYQRGQYGALLDYNINDVYLTARLLDKIIAQKGVLNDPRDPGEFLELRVPSLDAVTEKDAA